MLELNPVVDLCNWPPEPDVLTEKRWPTLR
jgi:hypothetical protein